MATIIGDAHELNIDGAVVQEFYAQHWKRKIALSVPTFYAWQFTQPPSNAGRDRCMLAIDDETRRVLGVMGLHERPFLLDGNERRGAELTTWIVDEACVGMGVGAKILQAIQERYETLIGMGITDLALPVFLRSGFRFLKAIPRYVKVHQLQRVKPHAHFDKLAPKLLQYWARNEVAVPYTTEPVTPTALQGPLSALQSLHHFARDADHLHWRYDRHPVFRYEQTIVRHEPGSPGVYLCTRLEESVPDLRIRHVMDCFGASADMPAALAFLRDDAGRRQIDVTDVYCTATSISRHFLANGWFSIMDDACFQFPHLFHPIEMRTPPTTSLIYWAKDRLDQMADVGRLYLTKQDADLDRPTLDTYTRLHAGEAR